MLTKNLLKYNFFLSQTKSVQHNKMRFTQLQETKLKNTKKYTETD